MITPNGLGKNRVWCLEMPYGRWLTEDGRDILFNRDYRAILERKDGTIIRADGSERPQNTTHQGWFYNGFVTPDNRTRAEQALIAWMMDKEMEEAFYEPPKLHKVA